MFAAEDNFFIGFFCFYDMKRLSFSICNHIFGSGSYNFPFNKNFTSFYKYILNAYTVASGWQVTHKNTQNHFVFKIDLR